MAEEPLMVTVRAEDLALIVGLALLIDDRTDERNSAMHRCRTILERAATRG